MIEKNWTPSLRSQFVTARTYCRPKNEDGTIFEDSLEMVDRTIDHQRNLWEAAKGQMKGLSRVPLNEEEEAELQELKQAILRGEGSLAGRTMWLGGTDVAKRFHASNFNCSYLDIKTVYDVVDAFHLLLLGCVHPDTQILDTKGNPVRVGDLKPNQEILTFDVNTGRNENGYVLALRYSDRDTKFEIKFNDGSSVRVTDNHEFYLSDGRLVKARGMCVGDSMLSENSLTVSSIEEVKDSEHYIDITVGNLHNFVLSNGVVTHNCGVGFSPKDGVLNGFSQPFRPVEGELSGFRKKVQVEVIRSTRTDRGYEFNREELYHDSDGNYIWHLKVGDSGLAWAKAAGKILAMKHPVDKIILDFSEIRPGGKPLRGFGWISSGDEQISEAFEAICNILVKRSDQLLTKIDILDVMNWLGTSLSSRRSAEMAMMPAEDLEAEEFATAKKDYWMTGNKQRGQSNNSIVFHHKPTKRELRGIFSQMISSGGSEPGFVNGAAAKKRAPWYSGLNPCGRFASV